MEAAGTVLVTMDTKKLLAEVRQRVDRRTFVQDVTEPLTGRIDQRKVAAKFNNIEHAVDELATAVEQVVDEREKGAA